jgi:hypothetical protein
MKNDGSLVDEKKTADGVMQVNSREVFVGMKKNDVPRFIRLITKHRCGIPFKAFASN